MEKLTNEEVYNIIKEQEEKNNITYMDATGLNYINSADLTDDAIKEILDKTKRDTESVLKLHAGASNFKWVNDNAMTKIIQTLMNEKNNLKNEINKVGDEIDKLTVENVELKNDLKLFKETNGELNKKLLEVHGDTNTTIHTESPIEYVPQHRHKMGDEHIMTSPDEFRI